MLQVTIQHHPSRSRYLKLLTTFLDSDQADVFNIVEDNVNSASGMRKAFQSVTDSKITHLLVLQDDILPSKDLVATTKRLIKILPNQVISLFSVYDTTKPLSIGKHWATIDRLYGLCAYVLPVKLVKAYLNFELLIKERIYADDVRLSMFLGSINKGVYLTAPSLVDHICWASTSQKDDDVPIENAIKFRIARNFIGFENSGLEVDWYKGLRDTPAIKIGQDYDFIRHYKK